jgi:hypothetical protein
MLYGLRQSKFHSKKRLCSEFIVFTWIFYDANKMRPNNNIFLSLRLKTHTLLKKMTQVRLSIQCIRITHCQKSQKLPILFQVLKKEISLKPRVTTRTKRMTIRMDQRNGFITLPNHLRLQMCPKMVR